jgi:hypothetical protein
MQVGGRRHGDLRGVSHHPHILLQERPELTADAPEAGDRMANAIAIAHGDAHGDALRVTRGISVA